MTPIGVVLDLDDTLFLERDYVRSGFGHLDAWCRRELNVEGVGSVAWSLFERGRRRTTITDALEELGVQVTPTLTARLVAEYRGHSPKIGLLIDARRFVQAAVRVGARLAVVTDGPAASQRAKASALGCEGWAERTVFTEELGSSKPDPQVFRVAVEGWDVSPGSIAYVADNPAKDFQGPAALGWRMIRVRREGSLHQPLDTPKGVLEAADLSDSNAIIDWIACGGHGRSQLQQRNEDIAR